MSSPRPEDETLKDRRERRRDEVLDVQWYLFVVLEGDRPLAGGARYSLDGIDEVVIGRGPERAASRATDQGVRRLVVRLPGRSMSAIHARIVRSPQGWALEDAGSTNGCFLDGQRIGKAVLAPDDVVEVGHCFLMLRALPLPVDHRPSDRDSRDLAREQVGFATLVPGIEGQLDELRRIARSDVTVVLCGETGTGKELLARGVHALSGRRGQFVAVNCGALTETLAESQLFGHVRGAFTGASTDALGFVRAADAGTLLLDEVGDLGRPAQVALLRVLQEREVVPVGSARTVKVDVRFVATSPRSLEHQAHGGGFRSDLFARLNGYTFATTPLRHRREDIGVLVAALFSRLDLSPSDQPVLAPAAGWKLLRHPWPLNVRELEQALRRSWALTAGGPIEPAHLGLEAAATGGGLAPPVAALVLSPEDQLLRRRIIEELAASAGNVAVVARRLGKARMQVHRWMKRLAIDADSFRG